KCAERYAAAVRECRDDPVPGCDMALRSPGGKLETLVAATQSPVRGKCTAGAADKLTFLLGVDDLVLRTAQACRKWGEDLVAVTYAGDLAGLAPEALSCQRVVGARLAELHAKVVRAYGPGCYVPEFGGRRCDRKRRDHRVERTRATAGRSVRKACGPAFDTLGLVPPTASPTLAGRIDALADVVVGHARHLAQRVYPPLNLGPTGLFGPTPVGVRSFDLVDPSRLNVAGTGPRPVNVELYYPSTPDAVAGVPREIVQVLGTDLFLTPTYRDVPRALGRFPLVLFSPGSGNDPWQYVHLAAHLASHGFLVASVEHHASNLLDTSDPNSLVSRPLDLSFLLDQFLALDGEPGSFVAGAIDAGRIGAAGHSLGAYAVTALATCAVSPGAFTDARIKAILPLDGANAEDSSQYPGIFSTITIPTLLSGGTLSNVTPLLQPMYDALTPGPPVMAYADLTGADHGTFLDICEIPDAILEAYNGGPVPTCEPVSLPWRYARHITNYLALNFFDATLNDNAEALARLDPAVLARIEDMTYQSKAGGCSPGDSCGATCTLPCGDGIVAPSEACDTPGEQGVCAPGDLCNANCMACVNCAGATIIGPDGGVFIGTTVGGKTGLPSSCGIGFGLSPERLFQWTPSVSHVATIETCGGTTDFDTALFIRENTCLGPDLACNDDACGSQSRITLPVTGGITYFIVVDGFIAAAGTFTLSVS
ncbi:MAG: alpha/beta hydrolase family protein, partial [Candidatus Binatia bacterium]